MSGIGYFERVVRTLRSSDALAALGFRSDESDIRWYGKGADHHDLMVMTKPTWTVPSPEGPVEGYEGVNVHFEARGPGSIQIDCELTPRVGSEAKKNQERIAPLLRLKGETTERLRSVLLRELEAFGVNTKRVRRDACDPTSLKVVGFELGLGVNHTPEAFAGAVIPIVQRATPFIESEVGRHASEGKGEAWNRQPVLAGTIPDCGASVRPPVYRADELIRRVHQVRGLPERNTEDVVKEFLILLGHPRDRVAFQIGCMDVRVADATGGTSMVVEVKRQLTPKNRGSAVSQAFGYARRHGAGLVVVCDGDTYEVYERGRDDTPDEAFIGRFQLSRYHLDDNPVLDWLRPPVRECPQCEEVIGGMSARCDGCGVRLW